MMQMRRIDDDNSKRDKLDINLADEELGIYSINHSQLKTQRGHRTNIRSNNINNKYETFGRDGGVNYVYGPTTARK